MIEALIAVIDRLLQLRTYREARTQRVFQEVLAPAFSDLLVVHRDYVEMFFQTSEHLRGDDLTDLPDRLDRAIRSLWAQRLAFEPVRMKLEALARLDSDSHAPKEILRFIEAIGSYLTSEPLISGLAYDSSATNLIEALRYVQRTEFGTPRVPLVEPRTRIPAILRGFASTYIAAKRAKWAIVCECFVEAQMAAATAR